MASINSAVHRKLYGTDIPEESCAVREGMEQLKTLDDSLMVMTARSDTIKDGIGDLPDPSHNVSGSCGTNECDACAAYRIAEQIGWPPYRNRWLP